MELTFTEDMRIDFGPDCEFELPNYMTRLAPEELDTAAEDKESLVVAVGADPKDGKILLITVTGKVMVFDARAYYIPDGPAEPADGGKKIFLANVFERWPGPSEGFYVDSKWMLEKSTSGLTGAVLQTNYKHEDNNP